MKKRTQVVLPPSPDTRGKGWITYRSSVVTVVVECGVVRVITGHICSTDPIRRNKDGSHVGVDNIEKTVVWGDEPFRHTVDSADDAFERSFLVNDRHLLKPEEAKLLTDSEACWTWFCGVEKKRDVRSIVALLRMADLDRDNRPKTQKEMIAG